MSEITRENPAVVPPELRALEITLAEEVDISIGPTQETREILGLPENVVGMTIVDLAAGVSPLTHDLLQAGANAYALDCIYQKSDSELHCLIEEYHQEILKLVTRKEEVNQQISTDKQAFWRSFRTERDRYKNGWLTQLPFPNNFSDITISIEGITHVGAENINLLWLMTQEALRITKHSSKVIMSPIYSETHSQLIQMLNRQAGLTVTHELPENATRYANYRRMTIIKN